MAFISNGTTILDAGAFSVGLGGLILLSEQTASSSASIEFTSGIDSTYDIYQFEFINIHPATIRAKFQFNLSTDGGSTYAVTKTTTFFNSEHNEGGSSADLTYRTAEDLAQSTSNQNLVRDMGNADDESSSGTLTLFNPSSTTYVKHFISTSNTYFYSGYTMNNFVAGYGNTTSAINAVKFVMSSGNIDAGTIKMYWIKGS